MSSLVVSVSSNPALRNRLSRGSVLRHTSQWHPNEGTPPEVPVPKNVKRIIFYKGYKGYKGEWKGILIKGLKGFKGE